MFPPKPLTARLDPLVQPEESMRSGGSLARWRLPSKFGEGTSFKLPVYSRILHDRRVKDRLGDALVMTLSEFGIPWLDQFDLDSKRSAARIIALEIDAPIDVEHLQRGAGIQLQLYGLPHTSGESRKYTHWKPAMPIELDTIEQLGQKIDAIRGCVNKSVPIGAAIVANEQTIYEDVRYLIDCGVDWIEILRVAYYDLTPGSLLIFDNFETTIAKGLKARNDSRVPCPLWLTIDSQSPREWIDWMSRGIQGICIDPYLASRRPEKEIPRDTLAGIKVQPVSAPNDHNWVYDAMQEMRTQLLDLIEFKS